MITNVQSIHDTPLPPTCADATTSGASHSFSRSSLSLADPDLTSEGKSGAEAGGRCPSHGAATQGRWHPARSSVKWGMRGELCHHLAAVRGRCASVSPPGCGGEVLHHVVVARGWAADLQTAARSSHVGEAGDGGRQVIFFLFHFLTVHLDFLQIFCF
jgi:hypothetical protein